MIRIAIVIGLVLCSGERAMAQAAQAAEVRTEARVFEVNRSRLKELGIPARAVSAERLESDFIINISESSLKALIPGPRLRLLQSFQLTTVGETPAEFRISSRVASTQSSAESQRLDVGFDFRLLTRVSLKREIAMTLISQAKIRNLGADGAESASPISGQAIRHEITTAEGASVAAGGFITEMDTQQLSRIGTLHQSPVFSYLFSPANEDQPELVVVLTPHLVRVFDVPVPSSVVRVVQPPVRSAVAPAPRKADLQTAQYTVQAAAFRTEARAGAYAMELSKEYPDVFVDTLETAAPGYLRYRVRVGHLPTIHAAKELENQLRGEGLEPFVAMLN
ncbi:MAG TPA: SPOR domain-containing protein [Terriglobia bacterium]